MGLAVTKQEAFWEACGYGHTDRVKAFIEEGIDVNWISYTVSTLFESLLSGKLFRVRLGKFTSISGSRFKIWSSTTICGRPQVYFFFRTVEREEK